MARRQSPVITQRRTPMNCPAVLSLHRPTVSPVNYARPPHSGGLPPLGIPINITRFPFELLTGRPSNIIYSSGPHSCLSAPLQHLPGNSHGEAQPHCRGCGGSIRRIVCGGLPCDLGFADSTSIF